MSPVIKLLIPLFLVVSGCSFKKEEQKNPTLEKQAQEADMTASINLFKSIYEGSPAEAELSLENIDSKKISSLVIDKVSIFDAVLNRGNPTILKILLDKGLSPFSTNTKDGVKPYQKISRIDEAMSAELGSWVFTKYIKTISQENAELVKNDFQALGIDCNDFLNLNSWFSHSHAQAQDADRVILIYEYLKCPNKVTPQAFSTLVKGEILAQIKHKDRELKYLYFLTKMATVQSLTLNFDTHAGQIQLKPNTLIKVSATLASFQESLTQDRVKDILSIFEEDTQGLVKLNNGVTTENLFLSDEKDRSKIQALVESALNPNYLGKSENCYFMCQQSLKLDSFPNF